MIRWEPLEFAGLGKLGVALALSAAFCSSQAHAAEEDARDAAVADGVSTALGLAAGAAEMNPLGPVLAVGMKAAVLHYARSLPDTDTPAVYAAAASVWSGAAVNNLCVTAAILTGGSFAPACIVLGAAWGLKSWNDSEHERLFWAGCAMLRQYADAPTLECIYTAPEQQFLAGKSDTVVLAQELTAP